MSLNTASQLLAGTSLTSVDKLHHCGTPVIHRKLFFPLCILTALACSGCGDGSSTSSSEKPVSAVSSVKIVSASPTTDTPLHVGDRVTLHVDVVYALTDESGSVSVVVQDEGDTRLAQNTEAITKGSGQKSFETEFVVPNTKTVQVFTPVAATSQSSTSVVDRRAFTVVPN